MAKELSHKEGVVINDIKLANKMMNALLSIVQDLKRDGKHEEAGNLVVAVDGLPSSSLVRLANIIRES